MCGSAQNEKKERPRRWWWKWEQWNVRTAAFYYTKHKLLLIISSFLAFCYSTPMFAPFFRFFARFQERKKNCIGIIKWGFVIVRGSGRRREKCSQVADKLCDLHQNDNKHSDKTPLFYLRRRRMCEKKSHGGRAASKRENRKYDSQCRKNTCPVVIFFLSARRFG